ncbi:SDR family oxidoreductase [Streptomyces sp. NPDC058964]|uniref:SDR family oxidoreductase n=1 Tax=Streptomyces sp. NPDC058964 TaxID=3346681 RepID=UPI003696CF0F
MTVLVTGATGTVGRDLVDLLLAKGEQVRALTRDPAKANLPDKAEVVAGDLGDAAALPALLDGVEKAFLFIGPDHGTEFAEAAAQAGLKQVVVLSSFTVTMDWPSVPNFIRMHHEVAEKALTDAGVPATFLRPSGFDYNILQWTGALRSQGVVRAPFADAALPLIHPRDIADAAAIVLTEPGHDGKAYILTGPEALTPARQTTLIADALGIPTRYEELSTEEAAEVLRGMGHLPEMLVPSVLEVLGPEAAALPVSLASEELTGRPARTFRQWVQENADRF